jgi:hypothetical protein
MPSRSVKNLGSAISKTALTPKALAPARSTSRSDETFPVFAMKEDY